VVAVLLFSSVLESLKQPFKQPASFLAQTAAVLIGLGGLAVTRLVDLFSTPLRDVPLGGSSSRGSRRFCFSPCYSSTEPPLPEPGGTPLGTVYRQKLSPYWWLKFYQDGRCHRESSKTTDHAEAKRRLKLREGALAHGQTITPRLDRLRFEDLKAALVEHVITTGCRQLPELDGRLRALGAHFAGRRAPTLEAAVPSYVAKRRADGLTPAGINRELAALRRMLRLGYARGLVQRLPTFRLLKEDAPRSGFFEDVELLAVRAHLPADLQVAPVQTAAEAKPAAGKGKKA